MKRTSVPLQTNKAGPAEGDFVATGGYLFSVEATLEKNATAAVVQVYGSNTSRGSGVLIAEITLSVDTPADGFTLDADEQGWSFVKSKIVSSTGEVSTAACVNKE